MLYPEAHRIPFDGASWLAVGRHNWTFAGSDEGGPPCRHDDQPSTPTGGAKLEAD
jgi:hypothetical protein